MDEREKLAEVGAKTVPTQRKLAAFDAAARALVDLPSDECVVVLRALCRLFAVDGRGAR